MLHKIFASFSYQNIVYFQTAERDEIAKKIVTDVVCVIYTAFIQKRYKGFD